MNNEQQLVCEMSDPAEDWASLMEDDLAAERHRRPDGEGGLASSSSSTRVAVIVAQVVRHGVEHDYQDVLELGVEGVLARYGIGVDLTEGETELLRSELLALGGEVQTREMALLAHAEAPLLHGLCQRTWSLREEALFRRVFLEDLRRRHASPRLPRAATSSAPSMTPGPTSPGWAQRSTSSVPVPLHT